MKYNELGSNGYFILATLCIHTQGLGVGVAVMPSRRHENPPTGLNLSGVPT